MGRMARLDLFWSPKLTVILLNPTTVHQQRQTNSTVTLELADILVKQAVLRLVWQSQQGEWM